MSPGRLWRAALYTARRSLSRLMPESMRAAFTWSFISATGGVVTWMAEEACRHAINRRVSGSIHEWPMEWFRRNFIEDGLQHGLSLGCGTGALERDVVSKDICTRITGLDISTTALARARQLADADGLHGITYLRGDFNRLELAPRSVDIVFFHQALHHVQRLEACLHEVASALVPGGLVYVDEYVGPSRDQWTGELLEAANESFSAIPRRWRRRPALGSPHEGDNDPSEAIRSSEIIPLLEQTFDVVERRDYGGNLLALIHPHIRWHELDENEKATLLETLLRQEDELMTRAPSYYSVLVLRNRCR